MGNYYLDGMTKEDWQHIDGETHYRACPMHEDSYGRHECRPGSHVRTTIVEWDGTVRQWVLITHHMVSNLTSVTIIYCPWCGEELVAPECLCTYISRDLWEEAQLRKGGL